MSSLKIYWIICSTFLFCINLFAQKKTSPIAQKQKWVNAQWKKMTDEEKIAQLFIIRTNSSWSNKQIDSIINIVKKFQVGGICFFSNDALKQAEITNKMQTLVKIPLFISMDAEWGLAMRLKDIEALPRNMCLGAIQHNEMIYEVGKIIGAQLKRMGVHINFAPVVDINNNPLNPVINDRSFGSNKENVSKKANMLIKGMKENGIAICLKHFPGHGDVNQDSHWELPLINKTKNQLNNVELYPYKNIPLTEVNMIMIAHLLVKEIDSLWPSSLSKKTIQNLLIDTLKYQGLIITDALEMKAIQDKYTEPEAVVKALEAGNDLICLPSQLNEDIAAVKQAIKNKKLSWKIIDNKVKKVLQAKYDAGLNNIQFIDTSHLLNDLNKEISVLNEKLIFNALTLIGQVPENLPLNPQKKYLYLYVGNHSKSTEYLNNLQKTPNLNLVSIDNQTDTLILNFLMSQANQYQQILIGLHNFNNRPQNNYGIDANLIRFINTIKLLFPKNTFLLCFGNPYILNYLQYFSDYLVFYEDNGYAEKLGWKWLLENFRTKGQLPIQFIKQKTF